MKQSNFIDVPNNVTTKPNHQTKEERNTGRLKETIECMGITFTDMVKYKRQLR